MADIDAGPSAWDFSSSYPLPFRVLFLSFSTLLGFATNLHILAYLGIDTSLVLDIRLDDYRSASASIGPSGSGGGGGGGSGGGGGRNTAPFVHPSRLYPPLYALSALGFVWVCLGWLVFMKITGGDPEQMVLWRGVPMFTAIVVGAAAVAPLNVLYRKERMMFLRYAPARPASNRAFLSCS